jgi:ankyrin repeat protein
MKQFVALLQKPDPDDRSEWRTHEDTFSDFLADISNCKFDLNRNHVLFDLNGQEYSGPALCVAAMYGSSLNVELLFIAGCNPNVGDCQNMTPLHWAAQNGHKDAASFIAVEMEAHLFFETINGKRASQLARDKGYIDIAEMLEEEEQEATQEVEQNFTIFRIG